MVELYEWQKELFMKWANSNYFGICKAVTSAGKTRGAVYSLKQYMFNFPERKCLIVAPSSKVVSQWQSECKSQNVDVEITTYQKAINGMYRNGLKADCLILDECHRASPEKQSSAIMKLHPISVLGLSATPGNSIRILGNPFYEVGWDKANICDFTVYYARYNPTNEESEQYDKWSRAMQSRASQVCGKPSLLPGRDSQYDFLTMRRRDCCYTFKSRITHTVNLIKAYQSKRMMVFFERNEQIKTVSSLLNMYGIRHSICSQIEDTLSDFESHKTNILLLAKKLREGFSDNTIETVILSAPTTRTLSHTQIVGRALRKDPNNPDKKAIIIAIIANGTSDTNLLINNEFPKKNIDITTIESVSSLAPGVSEIRRTGNTLMDYM